MEFAELVRRNRSIRRFEESVAVERDTLVQLVDLARLTPSSANLQPLKYLLSDSGDSNELIFPHLRWAGYLADWAGPELGERPAAYLLVLGDTQISRSFDWDTGLAAQTILLGAVERGLGGCIIATIARDALRAALRIDDRYEILVVIALGQPVERVCIESLAESGNVKYWRDAAGVHHVPKRLLNDIILTHELYIFSHQPALLWHQRGLVVRKAQKKHFGGNRLSFENSC